MISIALLGLGGALIALFAVLSMISSEREKKKFTTSITPTRPWKD